MAPLSVGGGAQIFGVDTTKKKNLYDGGKPARSFPHAVHPSCYRVVMHVSLLKPYVRVVQVAHWLLKRSSVAAKPSQPDVQPNTGSSTPTDTRKV